MGAPPLLCTQGGEDALRKRTFFWLCVCFHLCSLLPPGSLSLSISFFFPLARKLVVYQNGRSQGPSWFPQQPGDPSLVCGDLLSWYGQRCRREPASEGDALEPGPREKAATASAAAVGEDGFGAGASLGRFDAWSGKGRRFPAQPLKVNLSRVGGWRWREREAERQLPATTARALRAPGEARPGVVC